MEKHVTRCELTMMVVLVALLLASAGCSGGTSGSSAAPKATPGGTGVNAVPNSHSVALSWLPSTSAVIGYNVYRGDQSGGPYAQTNSSPLAGTTFSDSGVAAGQTYWYVVTAVAAGGVESVHSNEAMAAIPTP
jgi:fibronectin type 3 domain-containing protein